MSAKLSLGWRRGGEEGRKGAEFKPEKKGQRSLGVMNTLGRRRRWRKGRRRWIFRFAPGTIALLLASGVPQLLGSVALVRMSRAYGEKLKAQVSLETARFAS